MSEYSVEEVHELVEDLMSCCRCIGYATSGNERMSHISAAKAAKEKLISAYTHPPAQAAQGDALRDAYQAGFREACGWGCPVTGDMDSQAFESALKEFLAAAPTADPVATKVKP